MAETVHVKRCVWKVLDQLERQKKASFSSNPVDSTEEWRLYVVDLIHAISLVLGSWFFLEVDNSSASLSSFPVPLFIALDYCVAVLSESFFH